MVWGDGDTVKDPIGATYSTDNRADAPASEQIKSGTSLYTYYKKLIMIRKAYPEIARGDYTALQLNGTKVGGFISDWNDCRVCVLHNTSGSDAVLQLNEIGLSDFRELRVSVGSGQASLSGSTLTIPAQTSVVLK
jgi:glycosidase